MVRQTLHLVDLGASLRFPHHPARSRSGLFCALTPDVVVWHWPVTKTSFDITGVTPNQERCN